MRTTRPNTRHLTDHERQALADLFEECDTVEFLQCVAGLVSHNVEDYVTSQDAQSLIRKAAVMIAKSRRT
jgi:hypothetical protein